MLKTQYPLSDAHIHIANLMERDEDAVRRYIADTNCLLCACAHTKAEFDLQNVLYTEFPHKIIQTFGIHPQMPLIENLPFLENALQKNAIAAIGEIGFDMFCAEYRERVTQQEEVWYAQLDLALQYKKPIIVHCRRALDAVFRDAAVLKKIPAVIFHSWAGSVTEAQSLLKRNINAYFSLSKGLLNNNKKMIACAAQLPLHRLLLETDAPFQTLKNQKSTVPQDITSVYDEFALIRPISYETACETFFYTLTGIFSLIT